ncbi:immunoglobulin-like domain-containing protein [Sporosarcina ureae]|uniref:immunoglobulin-like domain-containing protein n=1 Tax=Sporosarcina ureae TaxID=1571 RepID=UPI0026EB9E61|nr:immunoglobulin-like domain-containing protein [Sporosarcina ureae]
MKRKLSFFLIMTLLFSIINPIALTGVVLAKAEFPGTITLSQKNGSGELMVTLDSADIEVTLHFTDNNERVGDLFKSTIENKIKTYSSLTVGEYYLEAKTSDEPTIKFKSSNYTISPDSLKVIKSTKGTQAISIEDGIPGAIVKIYNDSLKDFSKPPKVVGVDNKVKFDDLLVADGYRLTQSIRNAESGLSESVTIYPKKLIVKKLNNGGAYNNSGEIEVSNAAVGATLELFKNSKFHKNGTMTEVGTYVFNELGSGSYSVRQIQNNIEGDFNDEPIIISDEEAPVITLNGEANEKVTYPNLYVDSGFTVKDNIDKPSDITVDVKSTIPINNEKQPPGEYTITYIATDSGGNKSIPVVRNVIILPNVVTITGIHTSPKCLPASSDKCLEPNQRSTGDIEVNGIIPKATLNLYQDNSSYKKVTKEINEGSYKIPMVDVGKNYYVTQEINGVESEPSLRTNVEDSTPPTLVLNPGPDGKYDIIITAGDTYIEYGATAKDNVDGDISHKVIGKGNVNVDRPGIYLVTYSVYDNSENPNCVKDDQQCQITRTVRVLPKPVIAIGSDATTAEVGVKNIFSEIGGEPTKLQLYKENQFGDFAPFGTEFTLGSNQQTHVFENLGPGRYYVKQIVNTLTSEKSNTVEVNDLDRPYITLNGQEKLSLVIDTEKLPYYKGSPLKFIDPGIISKDYLENDLKNSAKISIPNTSQSKICLDAKCDSLFDQPGEYIITYSSIAPKRGKKAVDKHRTITVAPPKIIVSANALKDNKITVPIIRYPVGVTTGTKTTVAKLYNSYDQLVATDSKTELGIATFSEVPVGIGYYVTQTVNGIESQPSSPINVNVIDEAKSNALITSFGFLGKKSISVIDHKSSKITVTVPIGTNLKLKPVIESIGSVTPSQLIEKDFKNPVEYTVTSKDKMKTKIYIVTVKIAKNDTIESNPLEMDGQLSLIHPYVSLSPAEMEVAKIKGVTFVTSDKKIEAHIPSSNVIESTNSTFTLKQTPAKDTYDISWGNLAKFMQPIELTLPKTGTKTLAKLVDGYSVALPSTMASTSTTSLVNEPGTYALFDNIGAPRINETSAGSEFYTMQLALRESTGTIYYTTSSKDISFTSSARPAAGLALRDNYVPTATPSEILNWTKYTPNEKISTSTGELYAVVVNGNQISRISTIKTTPSVVWSKNIPAYEAHKVLAINFNAKVDREALYSGLIYVTDDATGQTVATELQMSDDGKTIFVVPKNLYTRGKQYTLHIDRQFKGNTKNKEFLKRSLLQNFKIY